MSRGARVLLTGGAVLLAAAGIAGEAALSGGEPASATARDASASTATVQRGRLSATVSQDGILTYRARPDGSPFAVVNHAGGTYTELPEVGDRVGCGRVLYRVDDEPVLLLCGPVPAYRALQVGDSGRDVRQLNRNLRVRGARDAFTAETATALEALQRRTGVAVTGSLDRGDAVVLPAAVRIAAVTAELGAAARPGALVARATSGAPEVQVDLDASQQREVHRGDRAQITLPGLRSVPGRVDRLGRVADVPAGQDGDVGAATIRAFVRLDRPRQARGLDRAPVRVEIATEGVRDALSVPVTAIVGKAGGGFAVEVVRDDGRRELVAVSLGLFDTGGGRVQVEGALAAGDRVVVPAP